MIKKFLKVGELGSVLYTFKREFYWVGFFSLVANILMLTPTLYMLQVFDRVLLSRSDLTLIFISLIVLVFFFMMAFSEWLRSRLLVRLSIKLDQALSEKIFNASFKAYLMQRHENPTEVFSDLNKIRQFLTGNGIIAFFDAPWTPIYIFFSFLLHPILGVVALVFSLIQLGLAYKFHHKPQQTMLEVSQAERASKAYLYSKLKNAEVVEAMGMVNSLRQRWLSHHGDHQRKSNLLNDEQKQLQAFSKFIRYTMQSLTLASAAILVIRGEISLGAMIAATLLITRALHPIDLLTGSWKDFVEAKSAYERLEKILKNFPIELMPEGTEVLKGNLSIKNLKAHSPTSKNDILKGLNLDFKAGQLTAIIGPSGSGKSTLARCLLGIWPNFSGSILLDKKPIEKWIKSQLGPFVGYLPQDIELFEGSVAENISRFYELDSEKVVDAARRAGIHEMILRFPKGYDTQIGEAARLLSGGQRQRLGLARAMYGAPSLIILDEPDANLDDAGEKALINAVKELKAAGKTIFLITHRVNILDIVDYLLVLDAGNVKHYGLKDDVLMEIKQSHLTAA